MATALPSQTVAQVNLLPKEDSARADLYALLARLFFVGPDQGILFTIAQSDDFGAAEDALTAAPLFAAWHELKREAAVTDAENATNEYNDVFVSLGRPPVSIFASHYLSENYKDLTLVHLRDELERLGLAREENSSEPEDHLAGLLEVMRHLVLRGAGPEQLEEQHRFINSYLAGWFENFCDLVAAQESTVFYRPVAELLRIFLRLEVESLSMA